MNLRQALDLCSSLPFLGCVVGTLFLLFASYGSTSPSDSTLFTNETDDHQAAACNRANAKMIEEVWRNGVRARVNGAGIVEAEEIRRCLEVVIGSGEGGQEIRSNAKKWRGLALDAVKVGGSSHNNLKAFLENITTSAKKINGVLDGGAEKKTTDAAKPNENSKN